MDGGSTSGDFTFGDNDKATFGNSSDLQLYHDGSSSFISDQGSGSLKLLASAFYVNNAANTENMIVTSQNGGVTLFHNNIAKIGTSSNGATVSGTMTATAFAGDGSALTGVGPATRTWSSQSRALNGTYTNSTGHDIVVFVCWWNNATNRICSWFVGGHTTAGFSTYAGDGSSMMVVPNGAQYRFNSQSNTLRSWSELR
jgi:hypothetical protein